MKEFLRVIQVISILGSVIFFIGSFFAYSYQESSQGMLPVIWYPFREITTTLGIIGISLGIIFVIATILIEIIKEDQSV